MQWFFNLEPEQKWGLTLLIYPVCSIIRAFTLAARDEIRERNRGRVR